MKKTILFTFLIIISLNVYAQGEPEKRASALTETMTEALSLNTEEQSKVYQIQLERFKQVASIRSKYQNNQEKRKAELKKVKGQLKSAQFKLKQKQSKWIKFKRDDS